MIYDRAPFDVILADAAGLEGVFRDKISLRTAQTIAAVLQREVLIGIVGMMEAVYEDMTPEEQDKHREFKGREFTALFARYIKERGRFHLWWD